MIVIGIKPGHDGSITVLDNDRLVVSVEAEKDSNRRNSSATASLLLSVAEMIECPPDVVAVGGWDKRDLGMPSLVGAGYEGLDRVERRRTTIFGHPVVSFSTSHERSHIMMALGMAPWRDAEREAVLVWEGRLGAFYEIFDGGLKIRRLPGLSEPGARYAAVYALADPSFPMEGAVPRLEDAGKVMALAAFADEDASDGAVDDVVERILDLPTFFPVPKTLFADSPIFNAGVEAAVTKLTAARLGRRIFQLYSALAESLSPGLPLAISGGCGLNCDWNTRWSSSGLFDVVFVPPCTNDSGSALGSAVDARFHLTGQRTLDWSVYAGLDFIIDSLPDSAEWKRCSLDADGLAASLAAGNVVAWVQGRYELGPRALGNRSLLAAPVPAAQRDRLNAIKCREPYRPIAPCCREEELNRWFDDATPDPYMLRFRRVTTQRLPAVTHVDGTARVQSVTEASNRRLYGLLKAVAAKTGVGVLCNTSLNFRGCGFINRQSDLSKFCEDSGVDEMVVGDAWYTRTS